MSELRAPDPTVDEMGWKVVSVEYGGLIPIAHAMHPWDCDPDEQFSPDWARYACWFAVACGDCFPDSPPAGHRFHPASWEGHREWDADPYLSWQLPDTGKET
jgi:hypothetical protein